MKQRVSVKELWGDAEQGAYFTRKESYADFVLGIQYAAWIALSRAHFSQDRELTESETAVLSSMVKNVRPGLLDIAGWLMWHLRLTAFLMLLAENIVGFEVDPGGSEYWA